MASISGKAADAEYLYFLLIDSVIFLKLAFDSEDGFGLDSSVGDFPECSGNGTQSL
jgi:hypothetical protein